MTQEELFLWLGFDSATEESTCEKLSRNDLVKSSTCIGDFSVSVSSSVSESAGLLSLGIA